MKKFLSLALALVLALALAVPSYAAEPEAETVGVIVDGERIDFSGAAPEVRSGKTMVPLKLLAEAMGGKVTPVSGTLLCTFGDQEVLIRPDSSCYYKNGCTYVPVRALAEPLGYDVFWDSGERAAVLIDRQALIDEIDQQFTVLNRSLTQMQQTQDPEKNYQVQADYVLSLDVLDELSGERIQMDLAFTAAAVTSADALELEVHMDLSDLGDLFLKDMQEAGYLTGLQAAAVGKALAGLTLEGRYDLASGDLYFHIPALAQLNELTGLNAGSNDWYHLTMPALSSLEELGSLWLDALGIPAALADASRTGELNSVGGVIYLYSVMLSDAPSQIAGNAEMAGQVLSQLFGDGAFRASGSSQVCHIGADELEALLGQEGLLDEMFSALGMDLTVRQDGTLSVVFEMVPSEAYLDGEDASVEGTMEVSAHKVSLEMTLQLGDMMTLRYEVSETINETSDAPRTAPPDGAAVVELGSLEELLGVDLSDAIAEQLPAA